MLLMFCKLQKKKVNVYVSKHNSNCAKQVILLMIPDGDRCHYLVPKIVCIIKSFIKIICIIICIINNVTI